MLNANKFNFVCFAIPQEDGDERYPKGFWKGTIWNNADLTLILSHKFLTLHVVNKGCDHTKKGTSKRKRASPKREKGMDQEIFRFPRNPVTKHSGSAPANQILFVNILCF